MQTIHVLGHEIAFVIFDVDGVLTDLYARLWEHYEDMTETFDLPRESIALCRAREESGEIEVPLNLRDGLIAVWNELADNEALLARVIDHFIGLEYQKPYPEIPGSKALIERLYHRSIALGLCTSNQPEHLRFKLQSIGVSPEWFQAAHTGNMEPRKPHPGALCKLCSAVGIPPEQTLYVGDTQGDARMALGAGVHFVGVLSGKLPKNEFRRSGVADRHIIHTVADLPVSW
jgi:HAD superfamily hydrolase (TIGR01549 family)